MSNKELPKSYNPADYEDKIYQKWEKSGYFNPDQCIKKGIADKKALAYSISMPPPNRTGVLHIGHAVMLVIQDILIRYHRMKGERTLWLPGTDHAAIATQTKVEKIIKKEGIDRHQMGREKFLERVRQFAQESHDTIVNQVKKMGSSCDWSREAYTFDETRNKAVRSVFKLMYDDGLIYRGYRIVNWCPCCQSTLADDEVEYKEEKGKLYWLKYGPFILATTRPETKLGDTAVAVYPGDKRYKNMVGKKYMIPGVLGEFEITVVADKAVDPKFGSGAIKVTPAHDFTDYEIAQKYNIPLKQIINEEGKMMANCGKYAGLTTLEARQAIVADMEKKGLIDHIDDNYLHNIAVCYRCGAQIEPIPSKQWFIDVNKKIAKYNKTIKQLAIEAVKKGIFGREKIKIIPERFEKNYYHWMDNLRDWCISRQIWFGHQIPVWYRNADLRGLRRTYADKGEQKSKIWDLKIYGKDIFDSLVNGTKKIEIRAGRPKGEGKYWGDIKNRDVIKFSLADEKTDKLVSLVTPVEKEVKVVKHFKNLDEIFKKYQASDDYPGKSVKELKKWWQDQPALYERIKKYGVWVIELKDTAEEEIYVGVDKPKDGDWVQDEDTLDTWFSSGLWTFSTLARAPEQIKIKDNKLIIDSADFKNYHPTSVLETGYDILFFWIARMIIMTTYAIGDIPFKDVYLHGLVRDEKGRKMSKSLGNAIDPLESCIKYGTDATRLSLVSGTTPGNDMNLSEEKIAGFRNFANKLWNIARYIIMNYELRITNYEFKSQNLTLVDAWILGKMEALIAEIDSDINNYKFSQAGEKLRQFTWDDLADWYIEASKFKTNREKEKILNYILINLLKLWHPFMPFVTEAIWREIGVKGLLMVEPWPVKSPFVPAADGASKKGGKDFELIKEIIVALRNARSEYQIKPSQQIKAVIYAGNKLKLIESQVELIKKLRTGVGELEIKKSGAKIKNVIYLTVNGIEIYLIMPGFDFKAESQRLNSKIKEQSARIIVLKKKLANKEFIKKAPVEIVSKEKEKLIQWQTEAKQLKEQLKSLK